MALIISDGCSLYNSTPTAKTLKNWTVGSVPTFLQAGRWGTDSYSLYTTTSSGRYMTQSVSLSGSTTIIGLAIKPVTAANNSLFTINNGTNTVALKIDASNQVVVYNGSTTTYYTTTSPIAINTWYYVELKVVWNATTGQIVFRMGGSPNYDSGATLSLGSSANTSTITLGNLTLAANCYYTDLLLMDGTGTTFNDFQGDVRIETLKPTSDGTNQAWSLPPNNTILTSANQARITADASGWSVVGAGTVSRQIAGGPEPNIFGNYLSASSLSQNVSIVISTPNGTSGYAVTAGQTLGLGCWLSVPGSYSLGLHARFYDSGGTQVGADLAFTGGTNTNSAWLWLNSFSAVTVPVNAVTCAIVFKITSGSFFSVTGVVLSTNSTTPAYIEPGGAHFIQTGEQIQNSDMTYVATSTVNAKETYVMSDLLSTSGNVLCVRPIGVVRKESAAAFTLAPVIRIGSTNYNGTTQGLPTDLTYQPLSDVFAINPATSAAWTRSEVNSMETGMELKS